MFLASVMAIDIEGFCTMANHLHLIVRSRPDVAANWSAEEIARKRLPLCPPYKPGTREVAETPSQADLDAILNNPGRVEQLRLRLSNPSWLMRFLTVCQSGRPHHRPVLGGAVQDAAAAR